MSDLVKVAVDAMGGDNAPSEIVKGAVLAVQEDSRIKVFLVGQEDVLKKELAKYPDLGDYHLYTTMEPCPMCMGTIVMGGIRKLHVAAKDKYCGALYYLNYDPWMKSKNMEVDLEEGELELIQLAWQGYHELRRYSGKISKVLKNFQEDCPKAIDIAIKMYEERYLDRCVEEGISCQEVYDSICGLLCFDL